MVLFSAWDDKDSVVGQLSYEQQVGSDGLTLRGLASYGESEPGGLLEPLEVEEETWFFSVEADYPIIRSRRFNFAVSGGFDYVDQKTDVLSGALTLSEDSLRVLHASATIDFRDSYNGANSAQFGIRQGLPIFGASESGDDELSRIEGDGVFTSLNAEYSRLQRITSNFNLFGRVGGQYGFTELLATKSSRSAASHSDAAMIRPN